MDITPIYQEEENRARAGAIKVIFQLFALGFFYLLDECVLDPLRVCEERKGTFAARVFPISFVYVRQSVYSRGEST